MAVLRFIWAEPPPSSRSRGFGFVLAGCLELEAIGWSGVSSSSSSNLIGALGFGLEVADKDGCGALAFAMSISRFDIGAFWAGPDVGATDGAEGALLAAAPNEKLILFSPVVMIWV